MDKIFMLLGLRFRQLFRMVANAGFGMVFFAFIVVLGVVLHGLEGALTYSPFYSVLLVFFILLGVDFHREDKLFLGRIFKDRTSLVALLFCEYSLFALPFFVFQLICGHFLVAFLLILAVLFVALISPFLKKAADKSFKKSLSFLSLENFEIKLCAEKRKGAFALAYLFTLLGSYHIAFFLVGVFVLGILLLESFKEIESRELLHWKNGFVWKKFLSNLKLISAFMALPLLLVSIFQYDLIYLILYSVFCLFCFLLLAVSYKYSNYNPLYKSKVNENIQAMFALISLLPGGIIITFSFALFHYFKAEKTMSRLA